MNILIFKARGKSFDPAARRRIRFLSRSPETVLHFMQTLNKRHNRKCQTASEKA